MVFGVWNDDIIDVRVYSGVIGISCWFIEIGDSDFCIVGTPNISAKTFQLICVMSTNSPFSMLDMNKDREREREREREGERERPRERERQRERETERERDRARETETERERDREGER